MRRKAECSPEEWAAHLESAKKWYHQNHEAEREKRRARSGTEEARARRRAYDMRPDVKAKRQARDKGSYKERWIRIKSNPEALEKHYARTRTARTGVDALTYSALLILQGNACGICGEIFEAVRKGDRETKGARYPCADHCHEGGGPRGLLCNHCNAIEGMMKATGLTPQDFCSRLHNYLSNPPANRLKHKD